MRVKKIYFITVDLFKARLYIPNGTASNFHDPLNKKIICVIKNKWESMS